ncbi:DUF389 domain-containing protein [Streptomyces lydicus]
MLHLRLMVPADRTEDVVELLETTVGTTHLAVLSGAAREPRGDVVLCDVAREAADGLLARLRAMGLDRTGSIAIEHIDLSLSLRAQRAAEEAPGEGVDAVLWESLSDATHEESTLSVTYLAFLTLATMIAACGVVLDNAILIVGAMAVGPEFGPLAGFCTALVRRAPRLAWRSLTALLVGFAVATAVTVGFSLFMDAVGLFHVEVHGPRRRERGGRPGLPGVRPVLALPGAAAAEPGGHRPRGHPDPGHPEAAVVPERRGPGPALTSLSRGPGPGTGRSAVSPARTSPHRRGAPPRPWPARCPRPPP